ncbi:MAG TPA: VWA domain-containing protein [Bacteroidales bacterium]|nr:VWA domain-containing protein [Bacteroidales bacterium]HQL70242.1 VWA domain-containing protein [Bacteroidales bacterium]
MFQFHNEEFLWLLLLIPGFVLLWWVSRRNRKKKIRQFGDPQVVAGLMPEVSKSLRRLKVILLLSAFGLIVIAIARPRFGSSLMEVKRNGIEMIVAIDVSNSMLTRDVKPNRLERAKKSVEKLISELQNDKIGLIVFAGDAYVQLPVTNDYASAKMFLSTINPAMVPKQGTAIGSAIDMAVRSFTSENQTSKVLVIFTDGENHEDDPVSSAKTAAEKGIVIHTVGMGLPNGQPVPAPDGNGFLKDNSGNVVMSKLDEAGLKNIALAGNGIYVRTGSSNSGIELISEEIGKMQQTTTTSQQYSDYDEKFAYPAALALLLLLAELFISDRITRKKSRIDIFKVGN